MVLRVIGQAAHGARLLLHVNQGGRSVVRGSPNSCRFFGLWGGLPMEGLHKSQFREKIPS